MCILKCNGGVHPPLSTPHPLAYTSTPRQTPPPWDGNWSGQYVSYWNAFLLIPVIFVICLGGGSTPFCGQEIPLHYSDRQRRSSAVQFLKNFSSEWKLGKIIMNGDTIVALRHGRYVYSNFLVAGSFFFRGRLTVTQQKHLKLEIVILS